MSDSPVTRGSVFDGSGFTSDHHGPRRSWSHYARGDSRCDAIPVLDYRRLYVCHECGLGVTWGSCVMTEQQAEAERLTPFRIEPDRPEPLPGFMWTGTHHERIKSQAQVDDEMRKPMRFGGAGAAHPAFKRTTP